jgi:CRISPR/Cas system CMR-associated protein Cmr1 (group 7 of RAMP superfamily)
MKQRYMNLVNVYLNHNYRFLHNNNEIEEMKNSLYGMSKLKTDVYCIVQNRSFTLHFMDQNESLNLLHSSKLSTNIDD